MSNHKVQVENSHYVFAKYAHEERWISYQHQLKEILSSSPKKVLEIGVGDKVVASYLQNNTDVDYVSVDIDEKRKPTIVASVTELPFKAEEFDIVCAFQILEHIPFEEFEIALSEIERVTKNIALISLPHFGPAVKVLWKVPFMKEVRIAFKIPFLKRHKFNGEHYWEIGKKGFSVTKIRKIFQKYFEIEKEYVPFLSSYHRFYKLKKK